MGGAVSSGESNDELIDNLLEADYIKSTQVELVFRAVDRALYYTEPFKSNAYKDLAWKDGNLHLSAPCIYSEVMENLQLEKGMSFLNLGSGTGYLSTMCGLLIGRHGVNHGIELYQEVADYAGDKLIEFLNLSPAIDVFDFCIPEFVVGNCLNPISSRNRYDRIYCGAACPEECIRNVTDLLKIGGICVMPVNDSLVQITRISDEKDERKALLPVSFATLISPREDDEKKKPIAIVLPQWMPLSLKELCRSEVRSLIREGFLSPETKRNDGKKRKRRRRQERRRASRLLVVQRRTAEDGDGGFVAVAYSLGNHSSDEEGEGQAEEDDQMRDNSDTDSDRMPDLEDANAPQFSHNMDTEHAREDQSDDDELPPPLEPLSSPINNGSSPRQVARPRGILSRARAARQNLNERASNNSSSNDGGIIGRLREIYRRRDQRSGFRSLMSAVTGPNSLLVRASNSTGSQTDEQSTSTSTSTNSRRNVAVNTRNRAKEAKKENNDDSCNWSTTDDSSSSSTTVSSSSDEDGLPVLLPNKLKIPQRTNHRASCSAESGVVTDSPERNDDDDEEDDLKENVDEKKKKIFNLKESSDAEEMEVDNESMTTKLKKSPVSQQMRTRINQLPLPPPIKLYLNYYRHLDSD